MKSFISIATTGLIALATIAQGATVADDCDKGLKFAVQEVGCTLADSWYDNLVLGGALPPAGYIRFKGIFPEYYQLPAQSKPYAYKQIVWNNLDAYNPGWYTKKDTEFELGMYLISNTATGNNKKALVQKDTFTSPGNGEVSDTYTFGDPDDTFCYITVRYACKTDSDPNVEYMTDAVTIVHPDANI